MSRKRNKHDEYHILVYRLHRPDANVVEAHDLADRFAQALRGGVILTRGLHRLAWAIDERGAVLYDWLALYVVAPGKSLGLRGVLLDNDVADAISETYHLEGLLSEPVGNRRGVYTYLIPDGGEVSSNAMADKVLSRGSTLDCEGYHRLIEQVNVADMAASDRNRSQQAMIRRVSYTTHGERRYGYTAIPQIAALVACCKHSTRRDAVHALTTQWNPVVRVGLTEFINEHGRGATRAAGERDWWRLAVALAEDPALSETDILEAVDAVIAEPAGAEITTM